MFDGVTPVEETIRALDDVVRAGKVVHVGYSDHPAWMVARADALAEKSGWTRPAAIQIEYNLVKRDAERELVPMAERIGMGVLAWAPLAGGALTGKYLEGRTDGRIGGNGGGHYAQYRDERTAAIARAVVDAAREIGCSPGQLATAWLIRRSPRVIPLVGARTPEQLADTLGAADLAIPDKVTERLDAISAIDLGFPHVFLRDNRERWFGEAHTELDPRIRALREGTAGNARVR